MVENWLKKILRFFFNEEREQKTEETLVNNKIRPGRFPRSMNDDKDVRVIHQYPKTGNFRFPLIRDDEIVGNINAKPLESKPRVKFTGKNFKASDVPSPVYGFRSPTRLNRENVQQEEKVVEIIEEPVAIIEELAKEKPLSSIPEVVENALANDEQLMEEHESLEEHVSLSELEEDFIEEELTVQEYRQDDTERVSIQSVSEREGYIFPTLDLLDLPKKRETELDEEWLLEQRRLLGETLKNFNVHATVTNIVQGPTVTRFEVQPKPGVKVSKITNLADDIKLNLSAKEIRIEAPIPGKNAIGIEVPNRKSHPVVLREILQSEAFQTAPSPLTAALGMDITGKPIVTDIKKMPHGLIAGATGSGKSVCINSILTSILFKAHPDDVKLMLIDPKVVELAPYNDLPHLVTPVITDVKDATSALKWAVDEMEERYKQFARVRVRDIERYNELAEQQSQQMKKMPYIVIVIDELADLMMVSPQEVEDAICRIAQKARACGIHLLVATQRPSVDVITGLIKANIPTRIAFSVSSQVDSRTILDVSGAEKLLGKGDMLFLENGASKPYRLQGNFVSDGEIERITEFIKRQSEPKYVIELEDLSAHGGTEFEDELYFEAVEFVFEQGAASTSSLQRRFRIGYNRAARLIDMMEQQGLISKANGSKPRKLLMTKNEFFEQLDENPD